MFKLRRFLRDLLSVTQIEASNIKGEQHRVIITSTLTQSLKHNFYGFYFVLMRNTVFFYAPFKNMCRTDLVIVIWVLDRIVKKNL